MDKELKEKWLARMRDPEFEHCKGTLRNGDAFCAIGALADVTDPDGWVKEEGVWYHPAVISYLPGRKYLIGGCTSEEVEALWRYNDAIKHTPKDIADYIEESL